MQFLALHENGEVLLSEELDLVKNQRRSDLLQVLWEGEREREGGRDDRDRSDDMVLKPRRAKGTWTNGVRD